MNLRRLHRKSAPLVFLLLFLSAITGVVYRLGRAWFGIPNEIAEVFIALHGGNFLGQALAPAYVLLVGLGLVGMLATGIAMVVKHQSGKRLPKRDCRWLHRCVAPIAFLPLLVSALTGIAYRLGRDWFGISQESASLLLWIHEGAYLGALGRPIYVLLVALALILLLVTGIQMTPLLRKRRASAN